MKVELGVSTGGGDHLGTPAGRGAHRLVARRALFQRLSAGGSGAVTLVSAPPGSGKTALLRSWIEDARLGDRVAWVSVERDESDAQRFWLSVVTERTRWCSSSTTCTSCAPPRRSRSSSCC
jgi:LuxR family maltose regulon positive regulatory protein